MSGKAERFWVIIGLICVACAVLGPIAALWWDGAAIISAVGAVGWLGVAAVFEADRRAQ